MKKLFLIVLSALAFQHGFGQTKWTKDDRNNLYSECLSTISKYSGINNDQKESVCLCYIDEISRKFNKDEYDAKIEAEIKRIRDTTLAQCSKNTGIDLVDKNEEVNPGPLQLTSAEMPAIVENLSGHWRDDNSEFWLLENGDYKMKYNDGKITRGTWKINNNYLDLYQNNLLGKSKKMFKILMFTRDKFVYQSLKNKENVFTAARVK